MLTVMTVHQCDAALLWLDHTRAVPYVLSVPASWAVKGVGEGSINDRQGSPWLLTSDTLFLSPPKHSRLVRPKLTVDAKARLCTCYCTRISKFG